MNKKIKKVLSNLILFYLILAIFFIIFANKISAQEFKRVQRESFPYSITFSFSITSISSSSYVSYQFNPYVYLVLSPIKNLDLFFQVPLLFSYNKTYTIDPFTEEVSKQENYLLSLTDIVAGFQWTFYTYLINDLFFYLSYPVGIYPIFYKRSSFDVSIVDPKITISFGYRATVIYDPLLLSFTPQLTAYYNLPCLVESKESYSQQYVISCKINLTIVLNSIISTTFSITPSFILPEISEFNGFANYELYKMSFSGEIILGIRISENVSLGLSIEANLQGYLLPEYEIYLTVRG